MENQLTFELKKLVDFSVYPEKLIKKLNHPIQFLVRSAKLADNESKNLTW